MDGAAVAPAAGTVLNALATGRGSAFAIDLETTATVTLTDDGTVSGTITGQPEADTGLLEACARVTLERYGPDDGTGVAVTTESTIPMSSGLKSSSAAANAAVLATLDALGVEDIELLDACRLGVTAAREAGVTVTGAFDDASASMLGGVTVTDNTTDELLARDTLEGEALVYTPPTAAQSADADVGACERIAPVAGVVEELVLEGRYGEAMTVNGFAYCGALGFSTDPMLEALPEVAGVSLSGTGPSYVALGDRQTLEVVRERWEQRDGTTHLVATRSDGARLA
ncbi:MAG: shikimate kinase [Natrialbaceae archaeon]|nr:shikimate kinase [Natrialbaceae archaeon]